MKQIIEIGKTLNHDGKLYVAQEPILQGRCEGCDFIKNGGCNAPDELYCGGRIFKSVTPEYKQDICFDYDSDTTGVKWFISILLIFVGLLVFILGVIIYKLIINLFNMKIFECVPFAIMSLLIILLLIRQIVNKKTNY